jgi:predicted Zn-dependent protease
MISIFITIALLVLVFFVSFIGLLVKRKQLREMNSLFREYNDQKDVSVLVNWIEQRTNHSRLIRILDYLQTIENSELATKVLDRFDITTIKDRQTRVFAAKAFSQQNRGEETLKLTRSLWADFPKDDTALELICEALINFGDPTEAKPLLEQRLERKFKGTQFPKLYARVLVHEGNLEKAITIMRNVVNRDYTLATNTIAQPQKGQIEAQYEANKALLTQLIQQHTGEEPPEDSDPS